jgi:hypothetical protein
VGRTSRPEYHRGKRRSPASTCSPLSQATIQRGGGGRTQWKRHIKRGVGGPGPGAAGKPRGSADGARGGGANGGPGIAKGIPAEARPCGGPLSEKSGDGWGGGIGSCRVMGSSSCTPVLSYYSNVRRTHFCAQYGPRSSNHVIGFPLGDTTTFHRTSTQLAPIQITQGMALLRHFGTPTILYSQTS